MTFTWTVVLTSDMCLASTIILQDAAVFQLADMDTNPLFVFLLKVAFVAIGATMVGSITFSKKEGDYVKKGDEVRIHNLNSETFFFSHEYKSGCLIDIACVY